MPQLLRTHATDSMRINFRFDFAWRHCVGLLRHAAAVAACSALVGGASAQDKPAQLGKAEKAETPAAAPAAKPVPAGKGAAPTVGQTMAQQLREALEQTNVGRPVKPGKAGSPVPVMTLNGEPRGGKTAASAALAAPRPVSVQGAQRPAADPQILPQYQRARAAAHGQPLAGREATPKQAAAAVAAGHGEQDAAHWAYEGEGGPQAWARLRPEFDLCGNGKRQSPIHIEESAALQGPAELLQFDYRPSTGTVVNTGRTSQVDVEGHNTLTVRGSTFKLLQFHFHHPAEEMVNYKGFAMVAHLLHRNAEGQLAMVAVLLDPGEASPFIDKVWTYLPLDVADRVRTPADWIDLKSLLPKDQRYYQFMGSLTTPPCSEGVLWMVLKQPATVSREQLKLFTQLFPNNARPVQALNGRVVRDAQ